MVYMQEIQRALLINITCGICTVVYATDGGWSNWSSWSHCLDSIQMRSRTRMCVNPSPTTLGLPCQGVGEQFTSCTESTSNVTQVYFNAHNPVEQEPSVGDNIIYGTVLENEGNGYSNRTGLFMAPMDGVYSFYVQLCTGVQRYMSVRMVANNKIIGTIDHNSQHFSCSSTRAISPLQKHDIVKINVTRSARYGLYETNDRWNIFSGFLLH